MPESDLLSDKDLISLTSPFQPEGFSKDRALELAASGTLAMVTEPGDRMAGALTQALGKLKLVSLLIEGLQTKPVLGALLAGNSLDLMRVSFGDLEETLSDTRQRWLPRLSKSRLEHLFSRSQALGLELVVQGDDCWPAGLSDLQDSAPQLLFVEGKLECLRNLSNAVSIVGSRAASSYGKAVTSRLVHHLARVNKNTVSGGAVGIDALVHRASLENGIATVAVMAGGLDRKYPRENFPLFRSIQSSGAVISEMPPGVAPSRWRFLQRNRLIAALSPTTVVVEAGIRSGSIRTANNALELDRELLAIPGSILSSTSAGTNNLILENRAMALCDFEYFGKVSPSVAPHPAESALAQRAKDAIRESRSMTRDQVSKVAGLTRLEVEIALTELVRNDHVIEVRDFEGELYYALKYA
jgi:DNA processing protein